MLIKVDDKEPYDRFRGRLMIPIRDPRGRVIAFGGRVIGDGEPKYLNSPDTPLFDKGRTLYNLDKAAPASRKSGRVIVVEGYMDVIALAQAGFGEAVAPLGTALTEAQLERLWRLVDVPILCFDGDAAGQKAAIRAALRALPGARARPQPGVRHVARRTGSRRSRPRAGPGGIRGAAGQARAAGRSTVGHEYAAEPLDTPEQRAGLKRRLADHAATIADGNVRHEYLAEFRRRVDALFATPQREYSAARRSSRAAPAPSGRRRSRRSRPQAKAVRAGGHRPRAGQGRAGRSDPPPGRNRAAHGGARQLEAWWMARLARLFEAVVDFALEDRALDSRAPRHHIGALLDLARLPTELLRPDPMPYSFTQDGADPKRASWIWTRRSRSWWRDPKWMRR